MKIKQRIFKNDCPEDLILESVIITSKIKLNFLGAFKKKNKQSLEYEWLKYFWH